MNLKKLERYLRVNLLGPGPRLIKKRIYRAAVSQRLRNTCFALWWHRSYVSTKHHDIKLQSPKLFAKTTKYLIRFLVNKTKRCTEFQFYWYYYSTCFGQPFCPSSGVLCRTSALVHFIIYILFAIRFVILILYFINLMTVFQYSVFNVNLGKLLLYFISIFQI